MTKRELREAVAMVLMQSFRMPDDSWFVPDDEMDAAKFIVLVTDRIVALTSTQQQEKP